MSLFRRGQKFSEMQTEEERYLASQGRQQAYNNASLRGAEERVREVSRQAAEKRRAITQKRRSRVKKVGTLRRAGRNKWITEGWQIEGVSDSDRNTPHKNTLGGLKIQDLCEMAHGKNCGCWRR